MQFDHNKDGSVIVKLGAPIKVKGVEHERLTIPAIKGKHLRACPFSLGADVKLGQLVDFAALIVEPIGCVDELPPADAIAVATEVGNALSGKAPGSD